MNHVKSYRCFSFCLFVSVPKLQNLDLHASFKVDDAVYTQAAGCVISVVRHPIIVIGRELPIVDWLNVVEFSGLPYHWSRRQS